MPCYRRIKEGGFSLEGPIMSFNIPLGDRVSTAEIYRIQWSGITVYFVARDEYFDRQELYGLSHRDYEDNFERFVFFQKAVVETLDQLAFHADIVHTNDWPTGLVSYFLKNGIHGIGRRGRERSVFSIHNLAYQGIFPSSSFAQTNLPHSVYSIDGMEYYGQISCMKAGIVSADRLVTVSSTYARQIQTKASGYGLHGVLTKRSKDLSGIVNGIDYDSWNPETDGNLASRYDAESLRNGKDGNKRELAAQCGLRLDKSTMLIGMVSRLVDIKGLDLIAEIIPELMNRDVAIVLLGTGKQEYHQLCERWARRWPEKFSCKLVFDPKFSHLIFGASDAYLMPSKVEPCGLSQLYSMRYGSLPIVHATGGLDDTVLDLNGNGTNGTGFKFSRYDSISLLNAMDRALQLYAEPDQWSVAVKRAMAQDLSWTGSASRYSGLYQELLDSK